MPEPDVTVRLTISGALTPTGLGYAAFVPLVETGFVDWIVSTGANIPWPLPYGIQPAADDVELRREHIIRIYGIVFGHDVLLTTDQFVAEVMKSAELQRRMSTAELHFRLGRYVREREKISARTAAR